MKKGNVLLDVIAELAIASILIFAFFSVNTKMQDNTLFEQRQAARDISFTIDAITSSPSSTDFIYISDKKQNLDINKEKCLIKITTEKKETLPTSFSCGNNDLSLNQEKERINLKS